LDTAGIVKTLYVREYRLPSFYPSLEVAPVDGFFLQIREETLTPGVVPRFAYPGKALQDSVLLEQFGHTLRCELASTVTMMYATGRQWPAMNGLCESSFNLVYLHVFSHCVGKNKTRCHVFDRAEILEAISSLYVANITADNLKWPGDIQISNQIWVSRPPSFPAIG
jgi:hypothetical protein